MDDESFHETGEALVRTQMMVRITQDLANEHVRCVGCVRMCAHAVLLCVLSKETTCIFTLGPPASSECLSISPSLSFHTLVALHVDIFLIIRPSQTLLDLSSN